MRVAATPFRRASARIHLSTVSGTARPHRAMRLCRRAVVSGRVRPARVRAVLSAAWAASGVVTESAAKAPAQGVVTVEMVSPPSPGKSFQIGPRLTESRSVEMDQRLTGQALLR